MVRNSTNCPCKFSWYTRRLLVRCAYDLMLSKPPATCVVNLSSHLLMLLRSIILSSSALVALAFSFFFLSTGVIVTVAIDSHASH